MPAREALIIASARYSDPVLHQLCAPAADAKSLGEILSNPTAGAFQVRQLIDRPHHEVVGAIDEFFSDRKPDDFLLLYFSGHGIKDMDGQLYFATVNTQRERLLSTGVAANLVNRAMDLSRSKSQLLILDCCYSGAFARGMLAKADQSVGTLDHFQGTGRIVLTASDATQYSLEANSITGSGTLSVFTECLTEGLSGAADINCDGLISIDELYDYVSVRVSQRAPTQRPMKWVLGAKGDIIIARNPKPVTEPGELPPDLIWILKNSTSLSVRQAAAIDLGKILNDRNRSLALAAELKLKELLEDDSLTIRKIAQDFLTEKSGIASEERERQAASEKAHQAREAEKRRAAERSRREKEEQKKQAAAAEEARLEGEAAKRWAEAKAREEKEEQERQATKEKARQDQEPPEGIVERYFQEQNVRTHKLDEGAARLEKENQECQLAPKRAWRKKETIGQLLEKTGQQEAQAAEGAARREKEIQEGQVVSKRMRQEEKTHELVAEKPRWQEEQKLQTGTEKEQSLGQKLLFGVFLFLIAMGLFWLILIVIHHLVD
jgi:Caspase domain